MIRIPAPLGFLLLLAACDEAAPLPRGLDAGTRVEPDAGQGLVDASAPIDAAEPGPTDAGADGQDGGPPDAGLEPLRDDALSPAWTWIEQARRAMDHEALAAAFAAEGWTLPEGSEVYGARIVPGVEGPAYVMMDAGGGAFSEAYWPASTVKVLSSIAALEFLHARGFTGAARVTWASGFSDIARNIVDRAVRVSSNQDYDRTIRIAGFAWMNESFLDASHGFPGAVIQRSYAGFPIRDIPEMTLEEGGRRDVVPARATTTSYGCGADGNCASLFELTEGVRRVVLDAEVPTDERFAVDASDIAALQDALCHSTPSFFEGGASRALGHAPRICHKPGWVPYDDCLDHGVVEDPATGERWLMAASIPDAIGDTNCRSLDDMGEHLLRALRRATSSGTPLQQDAGIAVIVQIDPSASGGVQFSVEALGADRLELFIDGTRIGDASGRDRFVLASPAPPRGERLVTVRAWQADALIGARSLRAAL